MIVRRSNRSPTTAATSSSAVAPLGQLGQSVADHVTDRGRPPRRRRPGHARRRGGPARRRTAGCRRHVAGPGRPGPAEGCRAGAEWGQVHVGQRGRQHRVGHQLGRAVGGHDEHPARPEALDHEAEHVDGRRVGPVQVVEHHQQRPTVEAVDQVDERPGQLDRSERGPGVAVTDGEVPPRGCAGSGRRRRPRARERPRSTATAKAPARCSIAAWRSSCSRTVSNPIDSSGPMPAQRRTAPERQCLVEQVQCLMRRGPVGSDRPGCGSAADRSARGPGGARSRAPRTRAPSAGRPARAPGSRARRSRDT